MLAASSVLSNLGTSSIGGFSPWASTTPFGSLTFDLGSAKQIDGLALWNLSAGAPAGLRGLSLFADDDADFSNGTSAGLGAFTLPGSYPFPVPAEVLSSVFSNPGMSLKRSRSDVGRWSS